MLIFCLQLQVLLCPILLNSPDRGGRRDHMQDLRANIPTSLYANAPEACFACICLVSFPQQVVREVFVFARKNGFFVVVSQRV